MRQGLCVSRIAGSAHGLGLPTLLEAVALAVHLQDVNSVSEAVQQGAGQPLRVEDLGPIVEGQVGGYQDRPSLVALAEDLEEELCAGLGEWDGTRMDAFDKYLKMSPITYAAAVTAPVLLLHGEADLRCPVSQSEQYFVELKRLGKEVEMVRFPGSYHTLTN